MRGSITSRVVRTERLHAQGSSRARGSCEAATLTPLQAALDEACGRYDFTLTVDRDATCPAASRSHVDNAKDRMRDPVLGAQALRTARNHLTPLTAAGKIELMDGSGLPGLLRRCTRHLERRASVSCQRCGRYACDSCHSVIDGAPVCSHCREQRSADLSESVRGSHWRLADAGTWAGFVIGAIGSLVGVFEALRTRDYQAICLQGVMTVICVQALLRPRSSNARAAMGIAGFGLLAVWRIGASSLWAWRFHLVAALAMLALTWLPRPARWR